LRDVLDEPTHARARDYATVSARSSIAASAVALAALLAAWFAGGFAWLEAATRALPGGPIAHGLAFLAAVFLASHLLELPFRIHDTFRIEARFGFNRTTPATFLADELKGLLLAAALGLPLAAAVLWIFHQVPHAWLWAWLVFTAFQLALTYLAPSLILPLFNRFEPMPDGPTRDAINRLAEQCRFPLDGIFVIDGSRRSTKANAYFTGLGRRKRIALYDTLLERHSADELTAVLAHEIGHFKCHHISRRMAVGIAQSAAMFFLLGLATDPQGGFARELAAAFGLTAVTPQAGIVFFAILFTPVSRLLGVAAHAWSRRHEFQADAFARRTTGSAAPLAAALKKLSTDNLAHPTPHPLRVALDYSHPPLVARLEALLRTLGPREQNQVPTTDHQ
jgi:STE24 endopeptidase